jgi:LacI family transcriptional regulator
MVCIAFPEERLTRIGPVGDTEEMQSSFFNAGVRMATRDQLQTNEAPTQRQSSASGERRRVLMALGYYDLQLHRGITRFAQEAGWVLDTSMAHYGITPTHWRGDGIITILIPERRDITRYVCRQKIPVVALYGDAERVKVPRVLLDDFRIGQLAAEHLLERGFTNLGFYQFTNYRAVQDRREGFRRTVLAAGRPCPIIDWHAASQQKPNRNWFDWIKRQLLTLPLPIGIMAQSDHRAVYLISACEAVGLAVPEQVAVIGADNDEQACEFASVPISSVDCNREMLAYEGARLLDSLMSGEDRPEGPITIAPRSVVVRRSSDIFAVAHRAVARALQFIREHTRESIGVDQVIEASGTSRCGLYRAFQKYVGRSVGEEIDRQRVEYAKHLLADSSDKLHRIAHKIGFSGPEHFTRVFRRVMGEAPSAYRKRCRCDRARR